MKDIAVVGAGGFGREVKMLIDQINAQSKKYNFIGYYDDGIPPETLVNGYPVLGGIDQLNEVKREILVVLAIGLPSLKKRLLDKVKNTFIKYPILIHPNVIIGADQVDIGSKSVICAGNIITVNISIGKHVILNLGCVQWDTIQK